MVDASSARVRVSPDRLKQIKKEIGDLDREIQPLNHKVDFLTLRIKDLRLGRIASQMLSAELKRLEKQLEEASRKRTKLDAKRKQLRMTLKTSKSKPV